MIFNTVSTNYFYVNFNFCLDLLKQNLDNDNPEIADAKSYMQECMQKKKSFIERRVAKLKKRMNKDDVVAELKDDFFTAHALRLAISGRGAKSKQS